MGGRRVTRSAQKLKGGQIRLDQMLTPRRSARRNSNANEKRKDAKSTEVSLKDDDGIDVIEIEADCGQSVTLLTNEVVKTGQRGRNKEKTETKVAAKNVQLDEKRHCDLLQSFDLDLTYGPCRGISRRERFLRAVKYDIKPTPDQIILKILDQHSEEFTFQRCIWDQNELLKLHV